MASPEQSRSEAKSARTSSLVDILDRTQGHLILKWSASHGAERLRRIGLTSLYCLVAVVFLLFFALEAWFLNQVRHAIILLIFAGLTLGAFTFLRYTGRRHVTNTFLVLLLATLCLFSLYTGGIDGTGPLWFFVFPIFALNVQRLWAGVLSVLVLFVVAIVLLWFPIAGFDPDMYSRIFKERLLAVYLAISIMTFLYVFLRTTSELVMDSFSQHLKELAEIDDLTKLPNRRHMQDILYQEISRLRRGGKTFCLILLDIDQFKAINDNFGHSCGDETLKGFAGIIRPVLRTQDICARWGGEEFLILLPETHIDDARKAAERVRKAIRNQIIKCGNESYSITASMGINEFRPLESLDDCIKEADKNLIQAKSEGKNRVVG